MQVRGKEAERDGSGGADVEKESRESEREVEHRWIQMTADGDTQSSRAMLSLAESRGHAHTVCSIVFVTQDNCV